MMSNIKKPTEKRCKIPVSPKIKALQSTSRGLPAKLQLGSIVTPHEQGDRNKKSIYFLF
jgi:hypothetical protein